MAQDLLQQLQNIRAKTVNNLEAQHQKLLNDTLKTLEQRVIATVSELPIQDGVLFNTRLAEKAKLMELAEEQIWRLFALWQETVFDGEIEYPDTFDIRDWATDLELLQQAKASNIKSGTFTKELDKQIARTVIEDDSMLEIIDQEIDNNTQALGEFQQQPITLPTV